MRICDIEGCEKVHDAKGLCSTHYQRAHRPWHNTPNVRTKHAFVTAAKLSAGCYRCGYKEHAAALQYDHVDPSTKKKSVASCMGGAWTILLNEMAKCRVACANCHNIHHYGSRYE